jgi:hypothetical protein
LDKTIAEARLRHDLGGNWSLQKSLDTLPIFF